MTMSIMLMLMALIADNDNDDDDDVLLQIMMMMLVLMAFDCRVRNMSCFRAKPASADSVALLAIVLPNHDDGDLIMENDDGHDHGDGDLFVH